ncbi:Hypothetical protein POVN_LOCUS560 [uncultured virus]|nr:Hypothetical protein POVN_LOCUS560 [uncultured virus]
MSTRNVKTGFAITGGLTLLTLGALGLYRARKAKSEKKEVPVETKRAADPKTPGAPAATMDLYNVPEGKGTKEEEEEVDIYNNCKVRREPRFGRAIEVTMAPSATSKQIMGAARRFVEENAKKADNTVTLRVPIDVGTGWGLESLGLRPYRIVTVHQKDGYGRQPYVEFTAWKGVGSDKVPRADMMAAVNVIVYVGDTSYVVLIRDYDRGAGKLLPTLKGVTGMIDQNLLPSEAVFNEVRDETGLTVDINSLTWLGNVVSRARYPSTKTGIEVAPKTFSFTTYSVVAEDAKGMFENNTHLLTRTEMEVGFISIVPVDELLNAYAELKVEWSANTLTTVELVLPSISTEKVTVNQYFIHQLQRDRDGRGQHVATVRNYDTGASYDSV